MWRRQNRHFHRTRGDPMRLRLITAALAAAGAFAALAAFRAGTAPPLLQVFEVGTATMMAAKGAIVPVATVMKNAKEPFEPKAYLPTVRGYYTDLKGNMLWFPFNSSTVMFYINKDAFKKAGLDPVAPKTWKEVLAVAEKLKAAGQQCVYTT